MEKTTESLYAGENLQRSRSACSDPHFLQAKFSSRIGLRRNLELNLRKKELALGS